jgi:hypothetical protein
MKTTLDLADALFIQAKAMAQAQNTTLRALVEEGLRTVLETRSAPPQPYKMRDCRVGSVDGLLPGADLEQALRDARERPSLSTLFQRNA